MTDQPTEMTPKEIHAALKELVRDAGSKAYASVNIAAEDRRNICAVQLWPDGLSGKAACLHSSGDDWRSAIDAMATIWRESGERHRADMIRRLALEIICITADRGCCTDAGLRNAGFDQSDIARYGEDAIADANEIASNGPFSITKLAGANAA